jgi:hypothetical protein
VQIPQIISQVLLVVLPPHPVHARRRLRIDLVERQPQPVHADMVQQRGELRILIPSRDLAHTIQRT